MYKKNNYLKSNIIIYGLGQQFKEDFFEKKILEKIQSVYDIIAVSDKRELTEEDQEKLGWPFISRERISSIKYDLILITSKVYYDEIKEELINDYQINEKQIISTDELLKEVYNHFIHVNLFRNKAGVEIGGPTQFFSENIYKVCTSCDGINFSNKTEWWKQEANDYYFENIKLGQVIIADATKLISIPDDKYDFCISSNNLEHIANPLKALKEFKRIIKRNGILLIVVPMKSECFDHNRNFTLFEHILNDYNINIEESDLSHLPEILEKHDYKMDIPCGGKDNFYLRSIKNFENRCLHHHVFSISVLEKMFEYLDIKIIESGELAYDYFILGQG